MANRSRTVTRAPGNLAMLLALPPAAAIGGARPGYWQRWLLPGMQALDRWWGRTHSGQVPSLLLAAGLASLSLYSYGLAIELAFQSSNGMTVPKLAAGLALTNLIPTAIAVTAVVFLAALVSRRKGVLWAGSVATFAFYLVRPMDGNGLVASTVVFPAGLDVINTRWFILAAVCLPPIPFVIGWAIGRFS